MAAELRWMEEMNGWEAKNRHLAVRVMKMDAKRCFVYVILRTPLADEEHPELLNEKSIKITALPQALAEAARLIEKYGIENDGGG